MAITQDKWVDVDPMYLSLGTDKSEREYRYVDYLNQAGSEGESQFIRCALHRNQLTGSSHFVDKIEHRIGLRVEHLSLGRPWKEKLRSQYMKIKINLSPFSFVR